MTLRERLQAVYRGETPDCVPYILDLSHWFYHRHHLPWDLSVAYETPEHDLLAYHREVGAGFYLPNLAAFCSARYPADVTAETVRTERDGQPEITWTLRTPLGTIRRTRIWEEHSYSWAIRDWGVQTEADLWVLEYALAGREYEPRWDRYAAWEAAVGDNGVTYLPLGYSAVGLLLNLWMGVAGTTYALADWPATMRRVIDAINANHLRLVDLAAASPAEVILMGDNFSTDLQPPRFFAAWSAPYYREAIRRLHAAGKRVALHLDGKLRGGLAMLAAVGADCADAVTPQPLGDLSPEECRAEAGPEFILSGGVSPDLWLPRVPREDFVAAVKRWLELKRASPRLLAGAGDQVPPGAEEERIFIMRDLVEQHGRY